MGNKEQILLEYGKAIFDRQSTNVNVKRDRIFTLGSLTLGILSINLGVLAIYVALEKTNSFNFVIFSIGTALLILSLIICFWNFKTVIFKELDFSKKYLKELEEKNEKDLLETLINNINSAYEDNETTYFPEKLRKDKITLAFYSALILDFVAILLFVIISIAEFIN
jgi:hypothetical protein